MSQFKLFNRQNRVLGVLTSLILTCSIFFVSTQEAQAHHAMGGNLPNNFLAGFVSGLAHPIIGLDHFAFVVAIGLLAATKSQGIFLPIAFLLFAPIGSSLHLLGMNLPVVEFCVASSVVIVGILLGLKNSPQLAIMIPLVGVAGLFHGYAYGEAIFGSETTVLIAYLIGFTAIQLGIALVAYYVGNFVLNKAVEQAALPLRFAGCAIGGIGFSFLMSIISNWIFPNVA